ncbi:MAG: hypothetical protein J4O03_00595 [Chloroflexi bacterium]|nr:hypothetical protein [Chloroflexota bacterium]MCH8348762.1 hypothetical protein [Chloroflexota bacterium]MCI0779794.1 hypothetical protein [Chloroflexota bacterium]MCI0784679.1 hypothetical protein [Chloroflexota bacterium]MCI0791936.1 hypothetical protein [Chloroflexota bacterium]
MMNDSLQYPTLARLLAINNRVHDLENQLLRESVPTTALLNQSSIETAPLNRIAEMQAEIDQGVRASLVTCWMGVVDDD